MNAVRFASLGAAVLAAGVFSISQPAQAAVCTFGAGSGEPTLQSVMNTMLQTPPAAATDCRTDGSDTLWVANGRAATTILVEFAGQRNTNTLGIYDGTDSGNRLQVFGGRDGTLDTRSITVTPTDTGSYYVEVSQTNGAVVSSGFFASERFGFYLAAERESVLFFSDTALNGTGVDHMYAYQGNGSRFRNTSEIFDPTMYIMAWEDLLNGGDGDYQDMVILTKNITAVPLPASFVLLASALGFMGGAFGRRAPAAAV